MGHIFGAVVNTSSEWVTHITTEQPGLESQVWFPSYLLPNENPGKKWVNAQADGSVPAAAWESTVSGHLESEPDANAVCLSLCLPLISPSFSLYSFLLQLLFGFIANQITQNIKICVVMKLSHMVMAKEYRLLFVKIK